MLPDSAARNETQASTQANAGILAKATAGITDSANLTTGGGDITLWANSAGATAGGIDIGNEPRACPSRATRPWRWRTQSP